MKKIIFTNLLTVFWALQVTDGIAATTVVQCDTSTITSQLNTCTPEVTLNIATTYGGIVESIFFNTNHSYGDLIFDYSQPVAKIINGNSHVSLYGQTRNGILGPSKRILINVTTWPNSSSVGISQLLSSKSAPISNYPSNAFYGYGPLRYGKLTIPNNCTIVDSSNPMRPVLSCTIASISYKPNMVISHVAPGEYQSLNKPVSGSLGKLSLIRSTPTFLQGFGIAVNDNFYRALQGKNISDGVLPSSCSVGDMTGPCQPSIKKAQLASLLSKDGGVKASSDLIPGDTTALTLNQTVVTHSQKAAQNLLLLNNPCGLTTNINKLNAALTPISSADSTNKLTVSENFQTIRDLITAISTGAGYQIGMVPLTGNSLYIKLDESSPNFDINGQASYARRTQTANGLNPLATMTYTVRMVNEDARVKAVADELWFELQSSFWSNIYGVAYLDLEDIYDSSTNPKQSKVQRLENTNCSPLIYYKNTPVIKPPSPWTPIYFSIGGIVSGLPNGQSLTLVRNGNHESITVSANGNFAFNSRYSGGEYIITVGSMPSGYNCTVQNGAGRVSNSDVNNISVVCTAPYNVSGTLSGLDAGQTITLSNNGNDPITLSANGAFNFTKPIPAGTTYSVSIQQEPNYKLCKVTQGSGTSQSNVTNVSVECLTPMVTTLAGSGVSGSTDGVGTSASFNYPWGIITDSSGNIFVSESGNDLIRKIDSSGNVVTFAGTKGTSNGEGSIFYHPMGIAIDKNRNLYIADYGHDAVKRISPTGVVSNFAGSGLPKNFAGPPTWGSTDGEGNNATFNNPSGVAVDKDGYIYVADVNNQLIRKISPNAQVSTIAGTSGKTGNLNGQGVAASFASPFSVAVDTNGVVYVADTINNRIRKITPSGVVSDFASIKFPRSVATDSFDNVYVTSDEQSKIYKVTPSGNIITLAGTEIAGDLDGLARNAAFSSPAGVTVDLQGNILVSDTGNHKIRKITFVKP